MADSQAIFIDTTPNAPMTKSQLREQNEILAGQVERYRKALETIAKHQEHGNSYGSEFGPSYCAEIAMEALGV